MAGVIQLFDFSHIKRRNTFSSSNRYFFYMESIYFDISFDDMRLKVFPFNGSIYTHRFIVTETKREGYILLVRSCSTNHKH